MTARKRPVLTVEQYRERVRQLRVEVANVAWSLVVGPAPVGAMREWRALTPDETMDVFDRLMRSITRMAGADAARIDGVFRVEQAKEEAR